MKSFTNINNLSITDQCCWPRHWLRRLYQESGVDSKGKDVVEVVDDATDEGEAADDDKNQPEE